MKKLMKVMALMMAFTMIMAIPASARYDEPEEEKVEMAWYQVVGTTVCNAGTAAIDGVVSVGSTVGGGIVTGAVAVKHGIGHAFIWCSEVNGYIGTFLLK